MRAPTAVQRRCCFHAVPERDMRALGSGLAEIHDAQDDKHDGANDQTGRANAWGRLIEFMPQVKVAKVVAPAEKVVVHGRAPMRLKS